MPLSMAAMDREGTAPYAPKSEDLPAVKAQRMALGVIFDHRRGTMGQIVLVTGGARSGKSRFAESLCLQAQGPFHYIATCPRIAGDSDLAERIAAHQQQRAGQGWTTREEPLDIERALQDAQTSGASALLECLGLWVSNLIYHNIANHKAAEQDLRERVIAMCHAWHQGDGGTLVVVGQEAGWGILPTERESRLWLDLLGGVRNTFAQEADTVWLVASGLPLCMKNNKESK